MYDNARIRISELSRLVIMCNGCGMPMREFGEWPVSFPKPEQPISINVQQAFRYGCRTCRTPHPHYDKGIPVMCSIIIPEGEH